MADASFPHEPEALSASWLSEVLGGSVDDFELEQIGVGVGLLGRLYRVTLRGDGVPSSVVAKFPTLDEGARMHVVAPMNFYEKEVRFYQTTANETPLGTPEVYFAGFDSDSGDFLILLEDLASLRMADQTVGCQLDDAKKIVEAIADHHARWWGADTMSGLDWLPIFADPPTPMVVGGMFKNAWPKFLEGFADQLTDDVRAFGERFPDAIGWFLDTGREEPQTFIHGDLRLDNVFFGDCVTVIDWQIAGRGPGGYDIAYFLSQSLTPDARRTCERDLIERYRQRLKSKGADYPEDKLLLDYRRTVAHCFCYPVIATGTIELANDRARALVGGMLAGAMAAIEDHQALSTWPD